jgi:hypothetical protein
MKGKQVKIWQEQKKIGPKVMESRKKLSAHSARLLVRSAGGDMRRQGIALRVHPDLLRRGREETQKK